jgi:hypothetical protein
LIIPARMNLKICNVSWVQRAVRVNVASMKAVVSYRIRGCIRRRSEDILEISQLLQQQSNSYFQLAEGFHGSKSVYTHIYYTVYKLEICAWSWPPQSWRLWTKRRSLSIMQTPLNWSYQYITSWHLGVPRKKKTHKKASCNGWST